MLSQYLLQHFTQGITDNNLEAVFLRLSRPAEVKDHCKASLVPAEHLLGATSGEQTAGRQRLQITSSVSCSVQTNIHLIASFQNHLNSPAPERQNYSGF